MSLVVNVPAANNADAVLSMPGWPAVRVSELREAYRLDGTVTTTRAKSAIVMAYSRVKRELSEWLTQQTVPTGTDLTFDSVAVLDGVIDGQSEKSNLFKTAVYSFAAATLNERMRGFDATRDSKVQREHDEIGALVTELRRDAFYAIRAIRGSSLCVAELL